MLTIEVENARSRIQGTVPHSTLRKIDKALSYELPGAYYARQYHPLAGMKRLFSYTTYSFPTGLLRKVIGILNEDKLACHIQDNRNTVNLGEELDIHGIKFRPYQTHAIEESIKRQRGVVKIGTGGGKTNVFIGIIAKLNVPTLILIHKTDIFYQIIRRLEEALKIKIGRIGDGECDIQQITVGMIQSIAAAGNLKVGNRDKKKKIQDFIKGVQCIITDECHHTPAESFLSVHRKAHDAFYKIGFSASPWRDDNNDMLIEAWQGKLIVDISASQLIDEGYLVPPLMQLLKFKHEFKPRASMRYPEIYDEEVVNNDERNKAISQVALDAAKAGKTVLIAVTKIDHGCILEAMLTPIEPSSIFVFGESESELRKDVLRELDERKRKIVICTTIFGEGVDVPNLDVLINAKAGASSVDAFQLVGRVLRKPPGKEKAYVVDIFDSKCKYLSAHSKAREKIYRTEPNYKIKEVKNVSDLVFNDSEW